MKRRNSPDRVECLHCRFWREPADGCRFVPRHPRCSIFPPDNAPKIIGGQARIETNAPSTAYPNMGWRTFAPHTAGTQSPEREAKKIKSKSAEIALVL